MTRRELQLLITAFCATVLFSDGTVVRGQPPVRKVALLVGINQYDKRGLAERPLQFAERDVTQTASVLKQQGFEVQVLTGRGSGVRRATLKGIHAGLERVLDGLNARDVVVVGLAGHGQQIALLDADGRPVKDDEGRVREDAFFCPVDTVQGDQSTMLSLTRLTSTLGRRGGVNLILVDACRDDPDPGRAVRSITGNELHGVLPARTAIVFSCAAGQQALETRDAGDGHGVFFYHVIAGLKGAAAKQNGDVTWGSLMEYIGDHTNRRAMEWFPVLAARAPGGRLQTPHELRNMTSDVNPVLARTGQSTGMTGRAAGEQRSGNMLQMALVWIPSGQFAMGSPDDEVGRFGDEETQVSVTLSSGFWMGRCEVTRGQWKTLMHDSPAPWEESSQTPDDFPATLIDWNAASRFCQRLTERERQAARLPQDWRYALPTEAQWEYACRAGTTTRFCSGTTAPDLEKGAWYGGFDGSGSAAEEPRVHRVGRLQKNAWGLYDMHGNAWEWCRDTFVERLPGDRNPMVEGPRGKRVHRGGSWGTVAQHCRSANRGRSLPDFREDDLGFRIVCEPTAMHAAKRKP